MAYYPTIFNQLFNFIPRYALEKAAKDANADRYVKGLTAWRQFLVLLYAQASGKQSLRDIQTGLLTQHRRLYHLGMKPIPKSTLGDAMNRRDPSVFEALFNAILERAVKVSPGHRFRFNQPLVTIDATTIDLCLSMFDWARFMRTKGAIKLHCQLDHGGHIPVFVSITEGKTHEINVAREQMSFIPDSIYCFDMAYIDFQWLYSLEKQGTFFVTRAKDNMTYHFVGQHPRTQNSAVLDDECVELSGYASAKKYPDQLRLVTYRDRETGIVYRFLTNIFHLAASTIARIYHERWQVEIFFKWIKQNLKIKTFLGTSRNAVMAQIFVAMIYYLILAYIKFQSRCAHTITEVSRRVKEALMHRLDLIELLAFTVGTGPPDDPFYEDRQLFLPLA